VTRREKLLGILQRRDGDLVSVLCPGGMMSLAVEEVMAEAGAAWPRAHEDAASMARLALAMQDATGFDNVAVPFCMTVEAERFGASVDLGGPLAQPRVRGSVLPADGTGALPTPDFTKGRGGALLEAIRLLRAARPDVPVIGNLVGPFSLLGMLADPLMLLRWTRRKPEIAARYLEEISGALIDFGRLQIAAGADLVCVAEPTATGEILGGRIFGLLVAGCLAKIAGALRAAGAPVILHICGDTSAIGDELRGLHVDAVSFDSMVDVVSLATRRPPWLVMGNLSPFMLQSGPERSVTQAVRNLAGGGIRLISPGCGVVPSTPAAHLRAVSQAACGSLAGSPRESRRGKGTVTQRRPA